jgi:hypothetical protein
MDGPLGYLELLAVVVLVTGAVLNLDRVPALARRLARAVPLVPPEPERPAERSIEVLAADLRRLHAEARAPRPGVTMARQRGIVAAYDDMLLLACRALAIETTLAEIPPGVERESERLRVEFLLGDAGLRFD